MNDEPNTAEYRDLLELCAVMITGKADGWMLCHDFQEFLNTVKSHIEHANAVVDLDDDTVRDLIRIRQGYNAAIYPEAMKLDIHALRRTRHDVKDVIQRLNNWEAHLAKAILGDE